jgi:putative restriction endonuclease
MDDLTIFDRPMFKRLAPNDTGAAAGHQGGIVIPKDLGPYFPDLEILATNTSQPTVDRKVRALLFVGNVQVGDVETRYQFQTWGGQRSPERRLTSNLSALRNQAAGNDLLVIERCIADGDLYRLRLIKQSSREFASIDALAGPRRWGPLYAADPPVPEKEVVNAIGEQETRQQSPLDLFDNAAVFTETRVKRVARSRAFQQIILDLYQRKCAVCGEGFSSPDGLAEVEGAHIVPRSLKGADDARNGFALCRSHHWAFDRGLFGVNAHGEIYVPASVLAISDNAPLRGLVAKPLNPPTDRSLKPADEALLWHMKKIVSRWS